MKRTLAVVIVALCSVLAVGVAVADVPPLVLMEGRLADDQGQPVDGDVTLSFQFFTQEADGEPLVVGDPDPNVELPVPVVAGVFRQWLALPSEVLGDAEALWVEVTVHEGQDSEAMTPRLEVVSVPYALRSGYAAQCGICDDSPCSCDLDDFDLSAYATIAWVEGMCITQEDLEATLVGYCEEPCGDLTLDDVQVYLTENGYLKLPGDEDILLSFLADNGFYACECYGDAEVASYLGDNDYHAGPHYGDSEVEAVLAVKNYCQTCYSDADVEVLLGAKGYCTDCYSNLDVENYLALYCAGNPFSDLCYGEPDVIQLLGGYCIEYPASPLCAQEGTSCEDCQAQFAWALADAPGGQALSASDLDCVSCVQAGELDFCTVTCADYELLEGTVGELQSDMAALEALVLALQQQVATVTGESGLSSQNAVNIGKIIDVLYEEFGEDTEPEYGFQNLVLLNFKQSTNMVLEPEDAYFSNDVNGFECLIEDFDDYDSAEYNPQFPSWLWQSIEAIDLDAAGRIWVLGKKADNLEALLAVFDTDGTALLGPDAGYVELGVDEGFTPIDKLVLSRTYDDSHPLIVANVVGDEGVQLVMLKAQSDSAEGLGTVLGQKQIFESVNHAEMPFDSFLVSPGPTMPMYLSAGYYNGTGSKMSIYYAFNYASANLGSPAHVEGLSGGGDTSNYFSYDHFYDRTMFTWFMNNYGHTKKIGGGTRPGGLVFVDPDTGASWFRYNQSRHICTSNSIDACWPCPDSPSCSTTWEGPEDCLFKAPNSWVVDGGTSYSVRTDAGETIRDGLSQGAPWQNSFSYKGLVVDSSGFTWAYYNDAQTGPQLRRAKIRYVDSDVVTKNLLTAETSMTRIMVLAEHNIDEVGSDIEFFYSFDGQEWHQVDHGIPTPVDVTTDVLHLKAVLKTNADGNTTPKLSSLGAYWW